MKTRRETLANNNGGLVPVGTGAEDASSSLPAQQQRVIGQLKTAMLNLNKRHGSGTTNEILNQIVQALAVDEEQKFLNFKPEYSDVAVDSELSNPPLPPVTTVGENNRKKKTPLGPVPSWFSFDAVSEMEIAHFGPLFSMDEERWKMYLSLRNDVVRIYEELIAPLSDKGELFVSSADLRGRLHPKDDAAYIFEIWKFLTSVKVINRGRTPPSSSVGQAVPVPASKPTQSSGSLAVAHTKINCSNCQRECRFFCYKALPPPLVDSPEAEEKIEEEGMEETANTEMQQSEISIKEEYMCHDCTPAYFEKIPLRLFIDKDTRDRIVRGEFEEVSRDDLRSFLLISDTSTNRPCSSADLFSEAQSGDEILKRFVPHQQQVIKAWDMYPATKLESASSGSNPLEILDPQMQEALSGAGQKIRGSVLIEQQVRNMVYGMSGGKNEEVENTCATSIERAWALTEQVFYHVLKNSNSPLPKSVDESPLFAMARDTDPAHLQLVSLVFRIAEAAILVKDEILGKFQSDKLVSVAEERLDVKQQFVKYVQGIGPFPAFHESHHHSVPEKIFVPVKIEASTKLASLNPQQLRLVSL